MTAAPLAPFTSHGATIPPIGYGTSMLSGDPAPLVEHALKCGYRHIDTAQKYGSEPGVGRGIKVSGVARAEIFLVTKVSHEYLHAKDLERTAEECLRQLGQDYVDLLLVHWPNAAIPLAETMGALGRVKQRGLTRHVGVANFNLAMLDDAIRLCPQPIVNLQTEVHPYLAPTKVIEGCRKRGVVVTGYCPLGRGRLIDDPVLADIARAHGRTPAQVALRWSLQMGVVPLPRSSSPTRIEENLAALEFALYDADMKRIAGLKRSNAKIADPKGRAPVWDD